MSKSDYEMKLLEIIRMHVTKWLINEQRKIVKGSELEFCKFTGILSLFEGYEFLKGGTYLQRRKIPLSADSDGQVRASDLGLEILHLLPETLDLQVCPR